MRPARTIRRTDQATAFPLEHFVANHLHKLILTAEDVQRDPSWRNAPIITATNAVKHALTHERAPDVAKQLGVPLFRWRMDFANKQLASTIPAEMLQRLHEHNPAMSAYFIAGAPGFLTHNIRVERGVSNGTGITLHSLSFSAAQFPTADEHTLFMADLHAKIAAAQPGQIIDLAYPPYSVNVTLAGLPPNQFQDATLVAGQAVIPVFARKGTKGVPLRDLGTLRCSKPLCFMEHPVELAIAVTFHRSQGRTMGKVIIDLTQCVVLKLSAVFVGLSRVRHLMDIRILAPYRDPPAGGHWQHLRKMQPPRELLLYVAGFAGAGTAPRKFNPATSRALMLKLKPKATTQARKNQGRGRGARGAGAATAATAANDNPYRRPFPARTSQPTPAAAAYALRASVAAAAAQRRFGRPPGPP